MTFHEFKTQMVLGTLDVEPLKQLGVFIAFTTNKVHLSRSSCVYNVLKIATKDNLNPHHDHIPRKREYKQAEIFGWIYPRLTNTQFPHLTQLGQSVYKISNDHHRHHGRWRCSVPVEINYEVLFHYYIKQVERSLTLSKR